MPEPRDSTTGPSETPGPAVLVAAIGTVKQTVRRCRGGTGVEAGATVPDVSDYLERRILVVVKTYPNPSSTYGETVCCAGVDLESGEWVRLYPITFRGLADRQFEKFQEIRCRATRPRDDTRPESWRVDQDSIELVGEPMKPALEVGSAAWPRCPQRTSRSRRSGQPRLPAARARA